MTEERVARYRKDWFTNPTFGEFSARIAEMHRKESETHKAVSRGESVTKINHQMGVVDGIERVQALLEQMHREMMGVEA